MKYYILRLTKFYITKSKIDTFIPILLKKVNNSILYLLQEFKQKEYIVCLSTAAPEVYAIPLLEHFTSTIDFIIGTPMPIKNSSWHENVRQIKADNTIQLLNQNNIQLKVLITDHYDDIPLLLIQKDSNILVSPSRKTISELRMYNIKYSIF
jgi:phosphoserine phosphatase